MARAKLSAESSRFSMLPTTAVLRFSAVAVAPHPGRGSMGDTEGRSDKSAVDLHVSVERPGENASCSPPPAFELTGKNLRLGGSSHSSGVLDGPWSFPGSGRIV